MSTNIIQVEVLEPGLSSTLQDLGRSGGRRYGVPPGGALDRFAHSSANLLVQNPPEAATLELTLLGPRLYFQTAALIAITGANLGARLNDRPVPGWMSVFVRAGQVLSFSRHPEEHEKWGGRAYLAVHGGFEAPLVMGSRSTYLKAHVGGYQGQGRALEAGDLLESGPITLRHLPEGAGRTPGAALPAYSNQATVRVVPGPHQENFTTEACQTFFNSVYILTPDSDRMGFRFEGPPLRHCEPRLAEIPACGTVFGTIQVPANGQPIVLMADHQVTGGYPVIGVILHEDLPLVAQLLPGNRLKFVRVD
ncbi:MAG TPA: biotin-dependent carboxyltransferase family protein [Chloroflexia bacterium]|nr:biotin-dependent carboxyltransferase family protein [Chloroflexia bacterium]